MRPATEEAAAAGRGAERRNVTTLFCDVVGSTALSLRLDPEEYSGLIHAYRDICSRCITDGGGVIKWFMGDGILAMFGYPQSHEDDPARACRTGLQIIGELREALPSLSVRVAAATGLVVSSDWFGDLGGERHSIIGSVTNLAARLQERAPPGSLLISDEVRALAGEAFQFEDSGFHKLKGIEDPVRAWRIVGERRIESRFAARPSGGNVGLVGRGRELDALLDCWRSARAGGRLITIFGEPGIGKSRLLHEFRERVAHEPSAALLFQCSSHRASTMLHPITDHLAYAARITPRDSAAERLEKLRVLFDGYPEGARSQLPIMAELLAIPTAGERPPLDLTPGQRKARTLSALTDWVTHLASAQRTLVMIEDYHWIDPTTAEWLELAMPRLQTMPVLCVVTSRTQPGDLASQPSHALELELSRLAPDDSVQLITHLAAGKTLPVEMLDAIMARTEGVPLFVEALTKSVLDSALLSEREDDFILTGPLAGVGIPLTLQDLLSTRLDSLGSGKGVAQLGSVLGRSFSYEMLARVSKQPAEALRDALRRLIDADLLVAEGEAADTSFTFRHALIQNAAYESLLLSKRRSLHERVADVLVTHTREDVDAHPEDLAFHLTHAEKFAEAACEWQRAGVLSADRSANREAVLHFESALAMLERIPVQARDRQRELDVLVGLTGALRATRGYAAREVSDTSHRALQLARALRNEIGELQALAGIYSSHLVAAEHEEADATAHELLEAAVRVGRDDYTMTGWRATGAVAFHRGRLREAEVRLQHALSLYAPERHAHHTSIYGSNHAETCACFLSLTKFALGAREEAIALQSWAVEHSREIKHAHSLTQAYGYRAFLFCVAGDPERAEADARSAISLASEHRFKMLETFADLSLAVAHATMTPTPESIAAVEEAIARCRDIYLANLVPFMLTLAAELCGRIHMFEHGLALLDEADETMLQTTERWAEAETRRVRGRLLADSGAAGVAERCFRDAIDLAREQGSETWRSRAEADLVTFFRRGAEGNASSSMPWASVGSARGDAFDVSAAATYSSKTA